MPQTLTIVFRGLMIFHEDEKNKLMEIGILREKTHVPRIRTIAKGVVVDIDVLPQVGNPEHRSWQVEVTKPVSTGISIYRNGSDFKRLQHPDARDFRFIMDFEGDDFYQKDLSDVMLTKTKLIPVLQVPYGEFYTYLKSPTLKRSEDGGEPKEFGAIASVTGCDISIEGGEVTLNVVKTHDEVFSFTKKIRELELPANTFFEITNTPPEFDEGGGHGHGHGGGGHAVPGDHFQFYYDLFEPKNIPKPRFGFVRAKDLKFAPNPLLCGKGRLGKRTEKL